MKYYTELHTSHCRIYVDGRFWLAADRWPVVFIDKCVRLMEMGGRRVHIAYGKHYKSL